jgi:membrane protein YqaA with SNARE-associated domain
MDSAAEALSVPSPPRLSWYRRLYLRIEALSATRYALAAMLIVSVIDGSVFPIPPFAILVPMVLATPKRWWSLALMGTVASLGGGLIGYYLGTLIHSGLHLISIDLNQPINAWGIHSTVGQLLGDNFWILSLLCSVLPTPFKVVAIGSGMVQVPLSKFMLAAVIGRTVRFYAVAGFMALFGPRARKWLRV